MSTTDNDFDAIAREHGNALYARALHLTGNRAQAWDLLQDTYEQGLRAFSSRIVPDKIVGWLLVIMKHRFIDGCRRSARRRRCERAVEPLLQIVVDQTPEAEDGPTWESMTEDRVAQVLTRLDPRLRAVYELHFIKRLPYSTIASRLNLPMNTVGSRLFRARRTLRKVLLDSPEPQRAVA